MKTIDNLKLLFDSMGADLRELSLNGFELKNGAELMLSRRNWKKAEPQFRFTLIFMKKHIQHLRMAGVIAFWPEKEKISPGNSNDLAITAHASLNTLLAINSYCRPNHLNAVNMEIMHEWDKPRYESVDTNNVTEHSYRIEAIRKQVRKLKPQSTVTPYVARCQRKGSSLAA